MNAKAGIGILVVGFGGPERFAEVRPFIEKVVAGRAVPASRVDAVLEQYRLIGGSSPYNKLTANQIKALRLALSEQGISVQTFLGLQFSCPSVFDAIDQMARSGIERAVGIIMAPHRTEASFKRYIDAVEAACRQIKESGGLPPQVDFIQPWHINPLFIEAIVRRVEPEIAKIDHSDLACTRIIFTAHSVPEAMSDESQYAAQVEATAAAVYGLLSRTVSGPDYSCAFQSRSGSPAVPWLEPDVSQCLALAKAAGKTHVIVCPIGFLVDHVEVLFDLDVLAKDAAEKIGVHMQRAATVGDQPEFIQLLAWHAREKIESFYVESKRH